MPNCNRCGAIIRWVKSKKGTNVCLDVKPVDPLSIKPFDFIWTANEKCFKAPKDLKDLNLSQPYFKSHRDTCVFGESVHPIVDQEKLRNMSPIISPEELERSCPSLFREENDDDIPL